MDLRQVIFKIDQPGLFIYFRYFRQQFSIVEFIMISTWIVGVEGEHADHLTTTTAQRPQLFYNTIH